jgi:hypothetical protein
MLFLYPNPPPPPPPAAMLPHQSAPPPPPPTATTLTEKTPGGGVQLVLAVSVTDPAGAVVVGQFDPYPYNILSVIADNLGIVSNP